MSAQTWRPSDSPSRTVAPQLAQQRADFETAAASNTHVKSLHAHYDVTYESERTRLESAVKVGDVFPPFALPNALGAIVDSEDLTKPLVIVFYRGSWCPYCNIHLNHLQKHLQEIQAAGGVLVAISPAPPDDSVTLNEKHNLKFVVLSDTKNELAKKLGITFSLPETALSNYVALGKDHKAFYGSEVPEYPTPSSFVIGNDGKIAWLHHEIHHSRRSEAADIVAALKALKAQ